MAQDCGPMNQVWCDLVLISMRLCWVWINEQKWWSGVDWLLITILYNWSGAVLGWFPAHYQVYVRE